MPHQPRKTFGQNFLINGPIIEAILQTISPRPEDNVVEIGPGLGALTQPLLKQLNNLTAVEIDTDLWSYLEHLPYAAKKLHLIKGDVLRVDFNQLGHSLRIVGNLPYNISTPLLLYLLKFLPAIKDMHFMLQKEVVARLAAQPDSKAYGRLSVIIQYHCEVDSLFEVPPEAFRPQPKVDSAIVRLKPHRQLVHPVNNLQNLEDLVKQAFSMRRKTLFNNLKSLIDKNQLVNLGIDPQSRPEQISVSDYVKMANYINK